MSSFETDLYDFVWNIELGEAIKSSLALEDVTQNSLVQLINDLSKYPLRICSWN